MYNILLKRQQILILLLHICFSITITVGVLQGYTIISLIPLCWTFRQCQLSLVGIILWHSYFIHLLTTIGRHSLTRKKSLFPLTYSHQFIKISKESQRQKHVHFKAYYKCFLPIGCFTFYSLWKYIWECFPWPTSYCFTI